MRKFSLVDKATGEETEADTVERVTGVDISCIDWVLEQTRNSKTGTSKCGFRNILVTRLEPRTSSQSGTGPIRGNSLPLNAFKNI